MTDQPTPTSSLEEARGSVIVQLSGHACSDCWSREESEKLADTLIAAARAEVIREVEAALSEHDARLARGYYWPTSAIQLVERLRALSQGGEGKA